MIILKISWIKYKNDNKSFRIFKNIGMDVVDIENREDIDTAINRLVSNDYKTIILSSDVAAFSNDIITKYQKSDDINIVIMPNSRK